MTRLLALPLTALLFLTGCPMTESAVAEKRAAREASSSDARPMTVEDSAAALQARIDSLREAMGQTQERIDDGFRETDSMRQSLDALGKEVQDTRRRVDEAQAETDALLRD